MDLTVKNLFEDGKKPLVCPVDPCKGVLCKSVSNTTCLVDNCNNCAVKFYDEALNEMTLEECNPVNKAAVCAPLKCEESCGVCDLSDGVPKCLPGNCAQSPTQEACDCPKCTKCYINKKGDQKCIPDGSCCQGTLFIREFVQSGKSTYHPIVKIWYFSYRSLLKLQNSQHSN